ncbi:RNA-binding S4 domain-containing protein [Butyrivibrio sp. YAB3001]|uniref:RNA-binding S4 domain-containing protein n=1 Tax=Butyrivibrio sp. YAB3001 TaxID=1520812 RepID=UPI0008F66F83|nr:RNA-binding S4 domain-containing protein [Butyrivibrio sp. YAB3001]SFC84979.1 ribosome-associated protein [Butyrivibrio sp. YAB3001]
MEIIKLREGDDFIKLGQALKKAGLEGTGVEAKNDILSGLVKVNGEVEERRGRKLYDGDIFEYDGTQVKIEK